MEAALVGDVLFQFPDLSVCCHTLLTIMNSPALEPQTKINSSFHKSFLVTVFYSSNRKCLYMFLFVPSYTELV